MSFDLARILREMNGFQTGIVVALVIMGMASLSVFVERLWVLRMMRKRARDFAQTASSLLKRRDYAPLAEMSGKGAYNPLLVTIGGGVKAYMDADPAASLSPVEIARREIARRTEAVGARARRGMGVLASVGSIAPFVGLLGTVVGIISAFEGIAAEGSAGLGAISSGIAEALVVTALGLVIAIPAVLAFNYLSARVDALLLVLGHATGEFLDHLEAGHGQQELTHSAARMRAAVTGSTSSNVSAQEVANRRGAVGAA